MALLLGSFGLTGLGGSALLFPCLVCVPMTIFFIVYIFGQQIFCGHQSPSVWLDKLCVHQTDTAKKEEQVNALPVFVAHSTKMLILWDDTYFERLWCNLELATCARYGGTKKIDVQPLWLAPWLLCTICLDLLSTLVMEILFRTCPGWSATWETPIMDILARSVFGRDPVTLEFTSLILIHTISAFCYFPNIIPSFLSFRWKLQSHQLMLQQMSAFDVRDAQCAMPSDRFRIEEQAGRNRIALLPAFEES